MRGATVCTGIGSPEVAAPWIDWRWGAEIDEHACAVLRARHPQIRNLGDMTRINAQETEAVDLIVAGTPCQDFSVAGLRAGLAGERGNLTLRFVDLLGELQPRWFVLENVPGLLSMDEGRTFGFILGALADIGYGFAYRVFDAQYAGVAQRRERVFVVGCLGDWRPSAAVLFERESLRRDPPPSREAGERVARPIASCLEGSSGYRNDADTADNLVPLQESGKRTGKSGSSRKAGDGFGKPGDPMFTLGADSRHAVAYGGNNTAGPIDVATARNAHGGPHGRLDFETETFIAFDTTQITSAENRCNPQPGDPCHPLPAHGHAPAIAFKPSHYTRGKGGAPSEIAPPLSADADKGDRDTLITALDCKAGGKTAFTIGDKPGTLRARHDGNLAVAFEPRVARNGRGAPSDVVNALKAQAGRTGKGDAAPHVASATAVRRLTPRECERLQGFPDDFTLVHYGKKPMADGPRYRMLGNAMAVPVIGWILDRIGMVDAHLRASEAA